ncbi:MAG TPA: ATP-binding protein [Caulobacteraceae bacterium]|nr:ATP-binding protein [Caulobacteraceae bacterium]
MRLPRLVRTTPFRLTLLFLALFAGAASAFLGYIYIATAGEAARAADAQILREAHSLEAIYRKGGFAALNEAVIERTSTTPTFLYLVMSRSGAPISGGIAKSPIVDPGPGRTWASFRLTETTAAGAVARQPARGMEERLAGGELLFVGADVGEAQSYVVKILNALWGAAALVIVLGLAGGVLVARDVSRNMSALTGVISAARLGDLAARAKVRGAGDELDELAAGLNDMLERLERSIAGLRHAGDAIAHDLRSPLTRLRTRMESALIEVEAGRGDARSALRQALDDADGVLKTFGAVLAIARLEAAAAAPEQARFDPAGLAADVAELYEPVSEEKGLDFATELAAGLQARGNREFIAQALANLLDNALKYTPPGGAVMLRVRRRSSGEIELSVTDTGPGVAPADRERVVERFVRLENSRNEPGAGLGLSLVAAVARAHGGRLELDEGPGAVDGRGPGLRAALVLPAG